MHYHKPNFREEIPKLAKLFVRNLLITVKLSNFLPNYANKNNLFLLSYILGN